MNHFEEILREGQTPIHQNFHENEQLLDKSTNQSNLMSTAVEQIHSPFDSSPKASMFFFSLNSPRQNTDNFHFNQQNTLSRYLTKDQIQPITRRLEFQEDQSLFCQEEEHEDEEHSVKEEEQWNFSSSETPPKSKKIKKNKNFKGLKNLSVGVYEIVAEKSQTTYKEVANSLIEKLSRKAKEQDISHEGFVSYRKLQKDQHNIKRRVYDALNVLISAELLRKEGKRVICNYNLKKQSSSRLYLQEQLQKISQSVRQRELYMKEKRFQLQQLKSKFNKIKFLITRNKSIGPRPGDSIRLPFVVAKSNIDDISTISIGKRDVQIEYRGNILIMGDIDTIDQLQK